MTESTGRSSIEGSRPAPRKSVGPGFMMGKTARAVREEKENEPNAGGVFLEVNDDEAEKRDRRKSRMPEAEDVSPPASPTHESRISSSPAKTKKQSRKSILPGAMRNRIQDTLRNVQHHYSNAQLADLYTNVIKMSTENKINAKNTWDLPLIDVMNDVISAQNEAGGGGMVNFQAASCTLDASVKIYSCRVDSTHSEAFKVLGGLTFGTGAGDRDDDEDGEGGAADGAEGGEGAGKQGGEDKAKKKSRRLPAGGASTIETNLDKITNQEFDLMFEVDPLFKKTSASFVEGGARGLLLNHLNVYNNCEIIFDSRDLVDDGTAEAKDDDNRQCDITDLQAKLLSVVKDLTPLQICPTFANFKFAPRSSALAEGERVLLRDSDDMDADPMMAVNLDDEPIDDDDDDNAGGGGFDFEANGDVAMEDASALKQEENLMQEIRQFGDADADMDVKTTPQKGRVSEGVDGRAAPALEPAGDGIDFGYLNVKSRNWAGPDHWKYNKPAVKAEGAATGGDGAGGAGGEGAAPSGKGRRKAREPKYLDFNAPCDIDFEEKFAKSARGGTTTLSDKRRTVDKSGKNTLPSDVHYEPKMLMQLFIKPNWRVAVGPRAKRQKSDDPFAVPPFGAAAAGAAIGDDENGFENFGGADYEGPGGADSDNEQFEFVPPAITADTDLIQAPRKVEKIRVNYAKSAKFVDVRALKDTIWTELRDRPARDSQDSVPESDDEDEAALVDVPEKSFTAVLNHLPDKVKPEAIANISVPFCFICLLHLANERGLEITQQEAEEEFGWKRNLEDITIQRNRQ